MLYLGNPSSDAIVEAMGQGLIGLIDQPWQNAAPAKRLQIHSLGVTWCADNGCFADGWKMVKWWRWLEAQSIHAATCLFATAPDVVGDAEATLAKSEHWLPRIRGLGYPVALVAQDGQENLPVPWDEIDALFIGGSTEWKLSPHARRLVAQAKGRGKHVHMGRVNSKKRFDYARRIGCDTVDGTHLTFGPDIYLKEVIAWSQS